MKFEEYLDSLRGKSVAVIGIGVSNRPLIRLLLERGIGVTACDKKSREALGPLGDELEQHGCRLQLGEDYLKDLTEDVIFRTPGLRPDVPELAAAVARGSVLTSEMEVFFEVCPCPQIAVTGSDGKTTTTTIIAKLLEAAGRTVHLGGNIGRPLLCDTPDIRPTDLAVLELSSFQLMTMDRSPHIAVMTNLSPNHLDVHKSYQEYIAAKENIFTHQTAQDIAIFNADNEETCRCAAKAPGRVRWFSRKKEVTDGVFLRGTSVVCRDAKGERVVMDTSDMVRRMIYPIVVVSQTIPTTAIAPLFVLWFGYGIWSKVLVTVLITFFPITITVYDGLRSAKTEMAELLQTYGATKKDIFLKIKVPCALPYFFSAIKMAVPMSIIGAAIGEWLGAKSGLGYFSRRMMTQLDGAGVFAPIVLLSAAAILAVAVVNLLEKRFVRWRGES